MGFIVKSSSDDVRPQELTKLEPGLYKCVTTDVYYALVRGKIVYNSRETEYKNVVMFPDDSAKLDAYFVPGKAWEHDKFVPVTSITINYSK